MSRRKRFWLILSGSIAGALALLVLVALLIAQSQWFGNFVKDKVISTAEDATGGRVQIDSFQLDPWHLTVRIRNFVLHGTEPASADPLARVALLELRLKLFAGLKHTIDLAYLGLTDPKVNLIVNPDGTTNVPSPKVKSAPSQTSGLETVVDLAIGQFRIDNGLLTYAQKASQFSARGNNLQALLNFNNFNSTYTGNLKIDPLQISSGAGTPLAVQVNLPIMLEKDAVSISGGRLTTPLSQILLNAGLRDLNAPKVTLRLNATVSLAEMQKSFNLPLDPAARNVPKNLTAELGASYDQAANSIQIQAAHLALGGTTFEAAGVMQPAGNQSVQFNGNLALDQLSRLLNLTPTQLAGALQLHGRAKMDANSNYAVDGTLNSKGFGIQSGTTVLSSVYLSGPFHADPYLISMDGLNLSALGGNLAAKIFVEKMQTLSLEGRLSNLSIPVLARVFAGHPLGYDGSVSGLLTAKSNLKAKRTSGLSALAQLVISPGKAGVPLSGRIDGRFNGASGVIDLEKSYIAMPNSRLDLQGNINQQLSLALVSHNLNDFLPAANFGSAHPATELPIKLQGGAASISAQINGNLSAPTIAAHASMDRFVVQGSSFQHLALDLAASQTGAAVRSGVLTSPGLQSNFDASVGLKKWQPVARSPLTANLSVPNGDLASILSLAGQKDLSASGKVNAEIHVNGTYGDPLGNASLQLANGVIYTQPFQKVQMNIDLVHDLVTLSTLEVDSAGGQLLAHGTFQHRSDSFAIGHAQLHVSSNNIQLANVVPLQQRSPGAAGLLTLAADGAGDLRKAGAETEFEVSNISTDLSALGLKVNNQPAGSLMAQARTANGSVKYNLHSDFAGSAIQLDGQTSLAKDFTTKAAASIQNLSVEKALAIAGQGAVPAKGTLSANANVSGTLGRPDALLSLTLGKAVVYGEPLNEFSAKLHYTGTQLDLSNLSLNVPAGQVTASASYMHKDGDLNNGRMQMHVNSSDIDLAKIKHLSRADYGVGGGLKLMADVAGDVRGAKLLLSDANASVNAHSLRANDEDLGELHLTAKTQQQVVNFDLESNLAKTQIKAAGTTQLNGDYITHAKLTFGNIRYVNIAPFIPSDNQATPSFDALVEGEASVDGPVLNLDALAGRLQLNQVVLNTNSVGSTNGATALRKVQLQNESPVIISLDHSLIKVQQLKIQGLKTYLEAAGSVSLKRKDDAVGLSVKGDLDLGLLQNADRDFYSSGDVSLDATVHGSLSDPVVNGKVELKNANVNYEGAPNGLSNANGVILLNGTNASIQNLTAESGGGKIVVTGFAGLSPDTVVFNLRAKADKVRTRYSGVSVTSSANIALAGNGLRSALSGSVTIHRISYTTSSDAGSILSAASVPPSTPAAPSPLLSGMHLDVRVLTAPDLRVVTTYAEKMSVISTLSLRGTAQDPGVVGQLTITNGQLLFFGNTYTVNTGTVSFYNPNSIEPILNLSLETIAQGVDVTLGVTGPVSDLKLTYRSDPPLSFQQIVQLLATNTTPSDPTIASQQPTPPQQSTTQMGESAVLGAAVANPLASRVQRLFGLTQFSIDPSISGSNGQPSARVTLQQKIASNLTFTYINDVTQTNSEIIRVQYDLTPLISAVALRDFNGNVSVELFYKFHKR